MDSILVSVAGLEFIVLVAIYWTLWKTRSDLLEGREKLKSELAEIRKSLESKFDKG